MVVTHVDEDSDTDETIETIETVEINNNDLIPNQNIRQELLNDCDDECVDCLCNLGCGIVAGGLVVMILLMT